MIEGSSPIENEIIHLDESNYENVNFADCNIDLDSKDEDLIVLTLRWRERSRDSIHSIWETSQTSKFIGFSRPLRRCGKMILMAKNLIPFGGSKLL